jgi:hypothetical protein
MMHEKSVKKISIARLEGKKPLRRPGFIKG